MQKKEALKNYRGFSGEYSLDVKIFNNGFALSRDYGKLENIPKIKISWYFNKNGRIEQIDRYPFQKKLYETFFKVIGYNFNDFNTQKPDPKKLNDGFDYEWINNFALFGHLSKDISCIKEDFDSMELRKQYRYIIALGHLTSLELIENIKDERISGRDIEGSVLSLLEIRSDQYSKIMIEKAAKLSPCLSIMSEISKDWGSSFGLINIIYEKMT